MRHALIAVIGILVVLSLSAVVQAEAEAAKGYVKEAQGLIDRNDADGAKGKLDLAEAELDGLDAATKAPIAADIAAARQKITDMTASADRDKYKRKFDSAMQEAEESIGNLATWGGAASAVQEIFDDPAAKAALGPDYDAAVKKFATFKKLNAKKQAPQIQAEVESSIKATEDEWTEAKKADDASKDNANERMSDRIAEARKQLDRLEQDDPARKAMSDRLEAVATDFTQVALADKAKAEIEQLKRQIDTYKDDWTGYEAETAGPSWEDYKSKQSDAMSAFLCPKSIVFVSRQSALLDELANDKDYQEVQSDKSVKAIVDDLRAKRDATYGKLVKIVTAVVNDAAKVPTTSVQDRLKDDVRLALGEKSPEGLALQDVLARKVTAAADAAAGADAAKVKLIETLRGKANEVWPGMKDGLAGDADPDLSHPEKLVGKTITFTQKNRSGWDFKPSDFYFAAKIGGVPVAGRVDPQLMKQIKATEAAIGRSIGDDDNDGSWEIFAVVSDRTTKLMENRQAEGTLTGGDVDVKVKSEYSEPVDAIVIDIVAAKCGPFAGAKDKGVLKEDGSVEK